MAGRIPWELLRYIANGLVATAVHYGALTVALKGLHVSPAWIANLMAAIFGILTSFLGSRHFVFKQAHEPAGDQLRRFVGLYGAIAVLHAVVMGVLTDIMGMDYRLSFIFATALQTALSYLGNKFLVFRS